MSVIPTGKVHHRLNRQQLVFRGYIVCAHIYTGPRCAKTDFTVFGGMKLTDYLIRMIRQTNGCESICREVE